jgi:hypothetical protein
MKQLRIILKGLLIASAYAIADETRKWLFSIADPQLQNAINAQGGQVLQPDVTPEDVSAVVLTAVEGLDQILRIEFENRAMVHSTFEDPIEFSVIVDDKEVTKLDFRYMCDVFNQSGEEGLGDLLLAIVDQVHITTNQNDGEEILFN